MFKSMPNPIARIKRTFSDISDAALNDIERAQIFAHMGVSETLEWETLLKSPRVLIISEAGSGKTYECQQEQQRLWAQDEAAFYLELAQLAQGNLRTQLSSEEEKRFDRWLSSQSGTATFFLDSFDELKLTQGSFKTALTRLEKELSRQLDRVRIVITTRPIPFDEEEFRRRLPASDLSQESVELSAEQAFADIATGKTRRRNPQEQREPVPIWRRVHLMPLSNEQIREMATNLGVGNTDELLSAIHKRNAEDFTRRPLDLIELCSDWQQFQRIRSHRDQLDHNIGIKLKARSDRAELIGLAPEKALDGASRLALACLLSRKLTLRHSAESDRLPVVESALDPADILYDWNEKERKTLLERALFGIANYGRVRFHHRSVIEFLAARQLKLMCNRGMATKALKRLLFAETPQGINVVKPSMRPVAAWVAESNQAVFQEVLAREPEVLLDFGDPESLTLVQRCNALRAYVKRYKLGSWRGMHIPNIQIHRFSNQELAPTIRELWEAGIENPEVRELLVEIVGAGRIRECGDLALAIAIDSDSELRERRMALETLSQLDDPHIPAVIANMLSQPEKWPEHLQKAGILSFFPNSLSIEQLVSLLENTSESRLTVGELGWHWPRLIAECSISSEYLDALRERLTSLVMAGSETTHSGWRFNTPKQHLVNALAAVCLRQVLEGCRKNELFHSSSAALRFAQDEYVSAKEPVTELKRVLGLLPDPYREALFWADIAFTQQFQPEADPWNRLYRTRQHGPIYLDSQRDSAWVLKNLGNKTLRLAERMVALELAIQFWDGQVDREQYLRTLKLLVSDCQELSGFLGKQLQPVKLNPKYQRLERQAQKAEEHRKRRDAKNFASWRNFWREVSNDPDKAFGEGREENTAWDLWHAATSEGDSEVAGWNRTFIEKYFNKEVADRLRLTLMALWRKDRPTLRCERPEAEKNTCLSQWQIGLAAIYAESEDIDWASKLSHEEALLATRYAPLAFNRLPNWLANLAVAHPLAVKTILGAELASELSETAKQDQYFQILKQLQHETQPIIELFCPQLSQWLDSQSPLGESEDRNSAEVRLRSVIDLLLAHGSEELKTNIKKNAEEKLVTGLEAPFSSVWLPTLLRLSPSAGSHMLINGLEGQETGENSLGLRWISMLFGDRHQECLIDLATPGFTPELLFELLRLAYKHVRPDDDISHEGTYSPGPRDHAQRARNVLLEAVLNLNGSEGWAIKKKMADDPLFAHFRDRALQLAKEKAAQETDSRTYAVPDILDLYGIGEASPATRDELYELIRNRLEDLEDYLLQDDSPRELWATISDEKVMRREIARALKDKANGIYTVDQEGVTADEKETDIRLRVANHDLQGVIELKLGDERSGRDLRDTLKNQLVMKYMAPENRRVGFLLITVAHERNWEHPETGARLDIDGLRNMLENEAKKLVNEMGWSMKLAVMVLNLCARLPKENQSPKKFLQQDDSAGSLTT